MGEDGGDRVDASARRSMETTFRHMAMNVGCNTIVVGTRPVLLMQLLDGDSATANRMLANWAGGIGLCEFIVNPALGRLSDLIGRKPFLLLGPVTNFLLKSLVALRPSARNLMLERIICGSLTTVSGSTTCSAVLSDLSWKNLSQSGAGLGAYAGLGCVVGPLLGGQLLARTGSVRLPFAVAALVALADIRQILEDFEETLEEKNKTPWAWEAINPLRVTKLFQGETSTVFKTLLLISALLCFPEGKNLSDFNQLYILNHVKMSPDWRTAFTVGFGMTMFAGGKLAQRTLKAFGERGHTTAANVATFIGLYIWARKPTVRNMFLGLLVLVGGMERRASLNAMLTKHAIKSGFTRGEFAGLFANFRALTTFVAPVLYSRIYQRTVNSNPGAPYICAGAVCMLGEAIHQTLTDKQLFIS